MKDLPEKQKDAATASAFVSQPGKTTSPQFTDNRPEAAVQKMVQAAADNRPRNPADVVQRKLLFDAGTVSYSLENGDQDYAYIGRFDQKNYYARYEDLDILKATANDIWTKVKAMYGGGGNMKKIKEAEEADDFSEYPDLAPGEDKYEKARSDNTKLYLVGNHAPGKDYYKPLVEEGGDWEDLQFYHANNENDDLATAMTAVSAGTLAGQDYNLFEGLLQRIMLNQGEPMEKNIGGGANRTAAAAGKVYVLNGDVATFNWNDDGNTYKEKLPDPQIVGVGDLSVPAAMPGAVTMKVGGKDAVYASDGLSKARTGKNFYIGGKPYTRDQIDAKKAQAEITTPWGALKNKTPVKQEAKTFSRKDRGKGQADAMGKWSANAAVVASNILDNTAYDESIAWEWLHLRGAGLGGSTEAGNLTPGTFSANSEMIPIENKIKSLKSNRDVESMEVIVEPKNVAGVFAKQIEMTLNVDYKGLMDTHTGKWIIDPFRGSVFDKIHEKKLRSDLEGKVDQRVIGNFVVLYHDSGLMTGPCEVLAHVFGAFYRVAFSDDSSVLAERDESGKFIYHDNAEDEDDD